MRSQGLILFAHGARDARWALPFESVAQRIRQQQPDIHVRLAFLELMSPKLLEAGAALCDAGCSRIEILPLFLGMGGHLRKDLPPMVDQLRAQYSSVRWTLHAPLGEHEAVMQAMASAALALLPEANMPKQP